jgi:hypothetical protein
LAGRTSGPTVNLAWGAANLAGGLVLLAATAREGVPRGGRWDARIAAFDTGAAAFAAWMAVSERVWRTNW